MQAFLVVESQLENRLVVVVQAALVMASHSLQESHHLFEECNLELRTWLVTHAVTELAMASTSH